MSASSSPWEPAGLLEEARLELGVPSWDVVWLELEELELEGLELEELELELEELELEELDLEGLDLEELELATGLLSSSPTASDCSSLWASSLHCSAMILMMPWTSRAVCSPRCSCIIWTMTSLHGP